MLIQLFFKMNRLVKNILSISFVLLLCNCALYEKHTMSDEERVEINKERAALYPLGDVTFIPHKGSSAEVKIKSYDFKKGKVKVQFVGKKTSIVVDIRDLGKTQTDLEKLESNSAKLENTAKSGENAKKSIWNTLKFWEKS